MRAEIFMSSIGTREHASGAGAGPPGGGPPNARQVVLNVTPPDFFAPSKFASTKIDANPARLAQVVDQLDQANAKKADAVPLKLAKTGTEG